MFLSDHFGVFPEELDVGLGQLEGESVVGRGPQASAELVSAKAAEAGFSGFN